MNRAAAVLVLAAALIGCSKTPAGVDKAALDEAIASSIGDPSTCVIVIKRGSGEVVYRYGRNMTCGAAAPSCDTPGTSTVDDLAKAAAKGVVKQASCATPAGGVGWAAGPVASTHPENGELAYAAAMNSKRGLPGREIATRLERAFAKGGF